MLNESTDGTTVGISFDTQTGRIDNVLVGGPAFASGKIRKGDVILCIDGEKVEHDGILKALKGSRGINGPGTEVEIDFFSETSSRKDSVVLRRVSTDDIADHRRMFDLFTELENKARRIKSDEILRTTQAALDLWSEMVQEEIENDTVCAKRVNDMQNE